MVAGTKSFVQGNSLKKLRDNFKEPIPSMSSKEANSNFQWNKKTHLQSKKSKEIGGTIEIKHK